MAGKGQPKTGGRKKGTPNKESGSLLKKCELLNFDPFEGLIYFAQGDWQKLGLKEAKELHIGLRFDAHKEISQYLYPKRKSLEHSGNLDPKLQEAAEDLQQLTKEEQIELLKEQLKELEK